jgi:glycine cleavage system H protein
MYFADSHEWIRVEGRVGYVGISRYAQRELGEVVYVQLPQVGRQVRAGEEVAVLESTKAAADIYSPVSGTIIAVNTSVKENSLIVNQFPEAEGWLFQVEIANFQELDSLLDLERYAVLIKN